MNCNKPAQTESVFDLQPWQYLDSAAKIDKKIRLTQIYSGSRISQKLYRIQKSVCKPHVYGILQIDKKCSLVRYKIYKCILQSIIPPIFNQRNNLKDKKRTKLNTPGQSNLFLLKTLNFCFNCLYNYYKQELALYILILPTLSFCHNIFYSIFFHIFYNDVYV